MKLYFPSILIFNFLLFVAISFAQDSPSLNHKLSSALQAKVEEMVSEHLAAKGIVGLAVGLVQNGTIVYLQGFGFEDREKQVPISTKTMFRWASLSKCVTGVLAMQLAEEGQLDLQQNILHYLPQYPDPKMIVSTHDLLCHQSGVPHYSNGLVLGSPKKYQLKHPFKNIENSLHKFDRSPLLFEPGTKYSYTSYGYILAGAVLQRAGKEDFFLQVQKRICQPLEMNSMQPDYQWISIPHRAIGYRSILGKTIKMPDNDVSWKLPAGGFISNIRDLALFGTGLMNGKLMSPKMQKLMWTRKKTKTGKKTSYGYGFGVSLRNQEKFINHSGGQRKTTTFFEFSLKQKNGVFLMSNLESAPIKRLARKLLKQISSP